MTFSLLNIILTRSGPSGRELYWEIGVFGIGRDGGRWLFQATKHFEWYRFDLFFFTLRDDYRDFIAD